MNIDSFGMGFVLVGSSVALAVLGLLLVRKTLHKQDLRETQVVASYLLAVVGTLYGVILGLIVVDSLGKFAEARLTTEQESNALADVYLLSVNLPEERKANVQKLALAYLNSVIDVEWPMMAQGKPSIETRRLAIALIKGVLEFEPKTNREQILYSAQVSAVVQFWNSRRTRMILAEQGIPPLEWLVLVVGGVITVVFTYFFKVDNLRLQLFMTMMLSTVIALNLYMVLMFGYPYSGDVMVEPDGFKISREIIQHPIEGLTMPR
jgi:Protein of unknown function (DUF4239)